MTFDGVRLFQFNIDDISNDDGDDIGHSDDSIPSLSESEISRPKVFSPIFQLDGNDDSLEQEIEILSGSKTPDGKRVCISPKR